MLVDTLFPKLNDFLLMLIIVENTNGLNMTGKVKDNNNIGVLSITLIKI